MGKGTGLGLATVHGIVSQNKGWIYVYTEPGQGTTFSIYLPRYEGPPEQKKKPDPGDWQADGGKIVLLVEDEVAILTMVTLMLKKQGYDVLTAKTPKEAIHLAKEHQGEINLLMTDVIMPEMNGRDLAYDLSNLYPGLQCLFMSGYTADIISHKGGLEKGVHFIQKPFSIKELAAKVRGALKENEGR